MVKSNSVPDMNFRGPHPAENTHQWFQHPRMPWLSCRLCGVVKRADGTESVCRGKVDVRLRHSGRNTEVKHNTEAKTAQDRIRELEAESASLRADRDANIAAWERVLGKRSEGEAQTYIRELEAALRNISR